MKNVGLAFGILVVALTVTGCTGTTRQRRTSVLEYLYPEGKQATLATEVQLELPLAIGLAFVPESQNWSGGSLLPAQQAALLDRVKTAFADVAEIERIEVIPSSFVSPGGGFENVDQIRAALGIELIVLVSFDQTQFDDPNMASITYWTIVGAYVVPGNENETHTMLDASVFDIESRALLMNGSGKSVVTGKATPMDLERSLRADRVEGFEIAVDDLIQKLGSGLTQFRDQVKTGTIRGQGTPAVEVTAAEGYIGGGGGGVGGLGGFEIALAVLLLATCRRDERRA